MQANSKRFNFSLGLITVGCLALLAGPASAGTVYSWVGEDGTLSFTDDPKRIPARYQGVTERREMNGLADYVGYTGADTDVKVMYATHLNDRLTRLRRANGAVSLAMPSGEGEAAFLVRTSGSNRDVSTQVGFPLSETEEEPIITNNVRMMPEGSIATRHVTIVRQGDQILSVVKPALNQYPGVFPSEADLPN